MCSFKRIRKYIRAEIINQEDRFSLLQRNAGKTCLAGQVQPHDRRVRDTQELQTLHSHAEHKQQQEEVLSRIMVKEGHLVCRGKRDSD